MRYKVISAPSIREYIDGDTITEFFNDQIEALEYVKDIETHSYVIVKDYETGKTISQGIFNKDMKW